MSKYGEKFEKSLNKAASNFIGVRKTAAAGLFVLGTIYGFIWLFFIDVLIGNEEFQDPVITGFAVVPVFAAIVLSVAAIFAFGVWVNLCVPVWEYERVVRRMLLIAAASGDDANALKVQIEKARRSGDKEFISQTADKYYDVYEERVKSSADCPDGFCRAAEWVMTHSKARLNARMAVLYAFAAMFLAHMIVFLTYMRAEFRDMSRSLEVAAVLGLLFSLMFVAGIVYNAIVRSKTYTLYRSCIDDVVRAAEFMGEDHAALKATLAEAERKRDIFTVIATVGKYNALIEQVKSEKLAETDGNARGDFDGHFLQQLGWSLLCVAVTAVTLGIAFPVTYVWMLRFQTHHTIYDGKRLSFDGNAAGLIGNWLKWLVLCIPTLFVYAFTIPKKLLVWKAKHTHFEGGIKFLGGSWTGNAWMLVLVRAYTFLLTLLTIGFLQPIFTNIRIKYERSRTVTDGRQITYEGKGTELLLWWLLWNFLSIVTLWIYAQCRKISLNRWLARRTHLGGYAKRH
ncbi:MAG TPA: DUF898 domain-containing protein [Firmicutes bacterium]|nr:DUF898 domain-containing protein [Bacillota bacterium]